MEEHLIIPDSNRGTDRAGRRAKRFLTPLQKYEIWLQLVRQEVTIAEAAERWAVDRATIAGIRVVAKERALGLSGRVPRRVDAATKAGLLDLLDRASAPGGRFASLPGAGAG